MAEWFAGFMLSLIMPVYRSVSRTLPPAIPAWGFVVLCISGSTLAQTVPETGFQHEGGRVFLTYCAGCHGFDGFAAYPPAPSFSMGERLEKDDRMLLQSILKGKGGMPSWEDKLPVTMLRDAISYLRSMEARRQQGLAPRSQPLPDYYFTFRPIGEVGRNAQPDMPH